MPKHPVQYFPKVPYKSHSTPHLESCQGCLFSTSQFNIFLEQIMSDAPKDHTSRVSIGGRTITKFYFQDDIDGLGGKEEELAK